MFGPALKLNHRMTIYFLKEKKNHSLVEISVKLQWDALL